MMYESPTVEARFWRLVSRQGLDECWPWLGARHHGYGSLAVGTRPTGRKTASAHRVAWELQRGSIPPGLEPDHLCRNKLCQNAAHMELTTHAENGRRGAAARWLGHDRLWPDNGPARARQARRRRNGRRDPVTQEMAARVKARDGGCVAAQIDPTHACADAFGNPVRWDDLRRMTMEHVQDGYGRMAKRALSDMAHLLSMCHRGNLEWAPLHRPEERRWLAEHA